MATAQTVIDGTLVRQQDASKTLWTDAELLIYANKAVDYLAQLLINRNDIYGTKAGSITTVDGTETYTLADNSMTDFVAMYQGAKASESGMWIDDSFLSPCRITERVSYTDSSEGEPEKYYITATSIGLLPVPDAVYTVSLLYFYKPTTLLVGTSMPYNDVFNGAIGAFIDSMAAARAEQDISNITQLYNELEKQALGVIRNRNAVRPRMVLRRR